MEYKILFAEDDADLRAFYFQIFEDLKIPTLMAKDGEEALALYHQHRASLRLVLTDGSMPKRGGPWLAQKILEAGGERPVLISGSPENYRHCSHLFAKMIRKPMSEQALQEMLEALTVAL